MNAGQLGAQSNCTVCPTRIVGSTAPGFAEHVFGDVDSEQEARVRTRTGRVTRRRRMAFANVGVEPKVWRRPRGRIRIGYVDTSPPRPFVFRVSRWSGTANR